MINAEEAREQSKIYFHKEEERTWKMIEESIKKAFELGRTECDVLIRTDILDDIDWSLRYRYGYTVNCGAIYFDPKYRYVTISW